MPASPGAGCRAAEQRGKALAEFAGAVVGLTLLVLAGSWALMVLVGVLRDWLHVPTIGYWRSVVVVMLARAVIASAVPRRRKGGGTNDVR